MDSTQSGGISDIPGTKPGVIASGPETSEPDVSGVLSSQNPNGVFGELTRKPTGGRPITPQPIDKITLDGGGGPKRSRKGLLIAGIALIGVALIAGVVALVIMNTANTDDGGGTSIVKETINVPSFNRLINYVVSGEESDTALDEGYDSNSSYYFLGLSGSEKTKAYKKTGELMKEFVDDYMANYAEGQEGDTERGRITTLVKSTDELFDFVNAMASKNKLSESEIRQMGQMEAMNYYGLDGLRGNMYADGFMEAYEVLVNAVFNNDADGVKDALWYVESYYDMAGDFVGSLFGINNLMKGINAMGVADE